MSNALPEISELQKKAESSQLFLKVLNTYLKSMELFEACNLSESPVEISIRGESIDQKALKRVINIAMLNSMYFFSRHKLELFKDDVRLALGQSPSPRANSSNTKGSAIDRASTNGAGSA